ncbi:putative membrane protein [Arcanobacterium pluranimalium]|uniref:YibE/F family protein n=1 Tax=Arcanobacterium pluranimalium TaxID=108028 RepID=UPI00308449CF|nr:putative membrane protein [Arcanobacterium pluranimalium]
MKFFKNAEGADGNERALSRPAVQAGDVHAARSHSHSHSHSAPLDLDPKARKKIVRLLSAIIIPMAIITVIAMVALWPSAGESRVGTHPLNAPGTSKVVGEISAIGATDQNGQTPVKMKVEGVEVPVSVPLEIVNNGLRVGDEVQALFTPDSISTGTAYVFVDFHRSTPLILIVVIYVLVVALVARGKGLAALVGLAASLAVVVLFLLPALMAGKPAFLVVAVGSAAMMFASIYFAHGISIRTTTAVLGTFAGLMITAVAAVISIGTTKLTGTYSDAAISLTGYLPDVSMQQILLAGMVLAGLGALNDVTITQVSTVWELHAANPAASRQQLVRQGMIVGRDHIASTVYTLAFAYVGTALPLLMAAALIDRGFLDFFVIGEVAEEIVRTLVASIGLVLAIPMTTAIAAILAPVSPSKVAKS